MRKHPWLWRGALAVLALTPSLFVGWHAVADDHLTPRERLVAAIPKQPSALINVTRADMPASPDILALGKRGTRALEQCMANNGDPELRGYCADLLGVIADRSALPALWVALEDWEPEVRGHVIGALAKIPDPRSLAHLLRAFRRDDENASNRAVVLHALGVLGEPAAVSMLRRELGAKSGGLQLDAFRALWRSRSLVGRSRLVADLERAIHSESRELAYQAILRASEVRAPELVPALLDRIKDGDADLRNKAVYALGLTGDKRAARPLRALIATTRDARMLNNIAFALERLDADAFYAEIGRLAAHPQAVIRFNATFVLSDIKKAGAFPLLEKALADGSAQVKHQAVLGLADSPVAVAMVAPLLEHALVDADHAVRLAAAEALKKRGRPLSVLPLFALVAERDRGLREAALYSIFALAPPLGGELVHQLLFVGGDANERHRAAIALAAVDDLRVRDYMLACLERKQCAVHDAKRLVKRDGSAETKGRVLRAWARGRHELAPLVAELDPAGVSTLALAELDAGLAGEGLGHLRPTIELLVTLHDPGAQPRLRSIAKRVDAAGKLRAEVALARLGDARAVAELVQELDDRPAEWLPYWVREVRHIVEPAVRAQLVGSLTVRARSADMTVALAASAAQLEESPSAALPRLLAGLHSKSVIERELALRYLRSRPVAADPLLAMAQRGESDPFIANDLAHLLEERR